MTTDYSKQILLFNKPYQWTSFDVVRKVKGKIIESMRRTGGSATGHIRLRIGHAGTLDPLATGLLVVCTGVFTKKIQEIQDAPKEYTGIFFLGATTESHDLESEVIKVREVKDPDKNMLDSVVRSFLGKQQQTPPAFSAIKVKGKRSYELARKGEKPELKSRGIEISEFEIIKILGPEIHFRIVCSKGTYIRSIAHDFGQKMGTGAYLKSLCRTRIGSYRLENALDPLQFLSQPTEIQAD